MDKVLVRLFDDDSVVPRPKEWRVEALAGIISLPACDLPNVMSVKVKE